MTHVSLLRPAMLPVLMALVLGAGCDVEEDGGEAQDASVCAEGEKCDAAGTEFSEGTVVSGAQTVVEYTAKQTGWMTVQVWVPPFSTPNSERKQRYGKISMRTEGFADATVYSWSSGDYVDGSSAQPMSTSVNHRDLTKACRIYQEKMGTEGYTEYTQADVDRCWVERDWLPWSTFGGQKLKLEFYVVEGESGRFIVEQEGVLLEQGEGQDGAELTHQFVADANRPVESQLIIPHALEDGDVIEGTLSYAVSAERMDIPNAEELWFHRFPFSTSGPTTIRENPGCFVSRGDGKRAPKSYFERGSYGDNQSNGVENNFMTAWIPEAGDYELVCPATKVHLQVNQALEFVPLQSDTISCAGLFGDFEREPNTNYEEGTEAGSWWACPGTMKCDWTPGADTSGYCQ